MQNAVASEFSGDYEDESKVFILMRVVFDLPVSALESECLSFKGWTNWPLPDAAGHVNLSWPVEWRYGKPSLLAHYEGSEGVPYGAAEEYEYFRARFPFRRLPQHIE
jgi:hypothetical protein